MKPGHVTLFSLVPALFLGAVIVPLSAMHNDQKSKFLGSAEDNSKQLIDQGRQTFRFDTYGDEAFWTNQLHMEQSVATLTPRTALTLGLKVDSDALPSSVVEAIKHGRVNPDDPAVTLFLIKQNAVLGVVGTLNNNKLEKVGFT